MSHRKIRTCQVKARKEKEVEFHPPLPYGKARDGEVDFGQTVLLFCVEDQELVPFKIPSYWEQMHMKPLVELVFHKKVGDIVRHDEFSYQIVEIR